MNLRRIVQVNLSFVAVVATLLLGSAQGSIFLPALMISAAGAAFYLTDLKKRFRLHGALANLVALIAVAIVISDVVSVSESEQLVSIANLLVYLQAILLFQEKTVRVAWQLMSLSLLQVVVGSAISDSIVFAAIAFLFLLFGLSTLALVCAYQESLGQDQPFVLRPARRRAPSYRIEMTFDEAPPPPRGFYSGLARFVSVVVALSMTLGLLVFVAVPRAGRGQVLNITGPSKLGASGFTDTVKLNDNSKYVFEDGSMAMRVWLYDDATDERYPAPGEIWLRGAVAIEYTGQKGWKRNDRTEIWTPPPPGDGQRVVRQEISLEPTPSHDRVFSVTPLVAGQEDRRLRFARDHITRSSISRRPQEFSLLTTGFHAGRQHSLVPADKHPEKNELAALTSLGVQAKNLVGLASFAQNAIADLETGQNQRYRQAFALEGKLKYSGEFGYTRALPERTSGMDPVEDFITTHKVGHCEFFASALALALRAQGTPARIALGYKSGEWNEVGGYLQVRQLHAHSWVEAYLASDEIPDSLKVPGVSYEHGAWLRLDPTPGEDAVLQLNSGGLWTRLRNYYEHVEMLWRNNVIGFDRARQEEYVYGWFEPVAWNGERLRKSALIFLVAGAVAWCLWRIAKWRRVGLPSLRLGWLTWLWTLFFARVPRAAAHSGIEFYDRFEQVLALKGMYRAPHQTPLEFALAVGGRLFDTPPARNAARLPRRIAEAFYRVRHGGAHLTPEEVTELNRAISELEIAVNARGA